MEKKEIVVELFHVRKDESIKQSIVKIGEMLEKREK